jgi:hypothetical protein
MYTDLSKGFSIAEGDRDARWQDLAMEVRIETPRHHQQESQSEPRCYNFRVMRR